MPMNIQEAYKTPNRLDHKRNSSRQIIIRTKNAINKDSILTAVREKDQVIYKGRPIRITLNFICLSTGECQGQEVEVGGYGGLLV